MTDQEFSQISNQEELLKPLQGGTTTPAHLAATEGKMGLIRKDLLTTEIFFHKQAGSTVILNAVKYQKLDKIPIQALTHELLTRKVGKGKTVITFLSSIARLDQIPKKALTREIIIHQDSFGECVLHHAAKHGNLSSIPQNFLRTQDFQEIQNVAQENPHYLAIKAGTVETIPIRILVQLYPTQESLEQDLYPTGTRPNEEEKREKFLKNFNQEKIRQKRTKIYLRSASEINPTL